MIRILLTTAVLLYSFSAHAQDYAYCNKKYRFGSPEWWKCMQDTSWDQKTGLPRCCEGWSPRRPGAAPRAEQYRLNPMIPMRE